MNAFGPMEPRMPPSNRETLAAATGSGGVWVVEGKTLAVESAGEFEGGIEQVQETFQVGDDLHAIVFKNLVVWFRLVVEVQLVRQTGAATRGDAHPNEVVVAQVSGSADFRDFFFGAVCYENHISKQVE